MQETEVIKVTNMPGVGRPLSRITGNSQTARSARLQHRADLRTAMLEVTQEESQLSL